MPTRRPLLIGLAALAVLAIAAPVTWYLVSPLFIRVGLEEPAPVVAAAPSVPPAATEPAPAAPPATPERPGSSPAATAVAPTSAPAATPSPATPAPLALEGRFKGADDFHFGRGRARLIEVEPGRHVVRFEDFAVRNGPDLYVYLSPDAKGYSKQAVELGRLRATDGNFNTKVPEGTDVTGIRSVVIWCKQFSVQFAVARLEP